MGVQGISIGAEKVQNMVADCGINSEENTFRKAIIDMHEEWHSKPVLLQRILDIFSKDCV